MGMRILSQRGLGYKDISYDRSYFSIGESAVFANSNGILLEMAIYSSFKKTEHAMEMLHEAYTGTIVMQNAEMSDEDMEQLQNSRGIISVISTGDNVKIEPRNIVWRFPQEDEL